MRKQGQREYEMTEHELIAKCRELPWSTSTDYNDSSFRKTKESLTPLFKQFGFGAVLGTLCEIWRMERAISFWERYPFESPTLPDGKLSIATFYTRAYNGGIERVQSDLIRIWSKMGFRVILITEEAQNPLDYPYPETVKRFVIPPSSEMTQRLQEIQRIIQEERISVYINHLWYDSSVIWECALMRINRIPYIVYQHGVFSIIYRSGQEFSYLCHRAFKLCSIIISLSESAAKFHQMCGCNSFYIRNPIPEELILVKEKPRCVSRRILWIGRISEEKRTKDALLMMKELLKQVPDLTLDIVGQPEKAYGEETLALCKELGLDYNVAFHGYQKDVSEYYKNCDLLIMTSETEGFALVLLEANAYGIPCVMYELPFLPDVTSQYGIKTVPQGRTDLMAESVSDLLVNDEKRWEYGERSRRRFEAMQAYDLQSAWKHIFNLCFGINEQDKCFFNPTDLQEYEKTIIPNLLSELYHAAETVKRDTPDYRIGHKLLVFPRHISHIIRRITGREGKL